jgi:hypothetical protein
MSQRLVLYQVCRVTEDSAWDPMGPLSLTKQAAERLLEQIKHTCPTAFIAQMVCTRMSPTRSVGALKLV